MDLVWHFAVDPEFAAKYAHDKTVARKGKNPHVYAVYLCIKKPLIANAIVCAGTPEFDLAKKLAGRKLYTSKNEDGIPCAYMQLAIDCTSQDRAEKLIRDAGYDGIQYMSKMATPTGYGTMQKTGESLSWVVFSPNQIKSAVDNDGSFDIDDPDIKS